MSLPEPYPAAAGPIQYDRAYTEQRSILGEASTMIAHEVNQPLTAIRTYAESGRRWLARSSPDVEEALSAMEQIITAAEGVAATVKRIRGVLRGPQHMMHSLVLDDLVRRRARACRRTLKELGVKLLVRPGAAGVHILGDPILLEQALLNMIANAVDAITEASDSPGRIWITTRSEGGSLVLTVRDNGGGFSEMMCASALEPFISSRPERLGLGLSICRSTAFAHGGAIKITNNTSERGAIVRLILPVCA